MTHARIADETGVAGNRQGHDLPQSDRNGGGWPADLAWNWAIVFGVTGHHDQGTPRTLYICTSCASIAAKSNVLMALRRQSFGPRDSPRSQRHNQ